MHGASACTTACTRSGERAHDQTVEELAAALLRLAPADRARLAAMLLEQSRESP